MKLKRKLEYKSAHLEEFIRPKVVIRALEILKESGNKYYQSIEINKEFTTRENSNQEIENDRNITQIEEQVGNISDDTDALNAVVSVYDVLLFSFGLDEDELNDHMEEHRTIKLHR